jgi:hypothetical protein
MSTSDGVTGVDAIHTIFLGNQRKLLDLQLDTTSTIFFNLYGMETEVNITNEGLLQMRFEYNGADDTRLFASEVFLVLRLLPLY